MNDNTGPKRLSRGRFLGLGAGVAAMAITPLSLSAKEESSDAPNSAKALIPARQAEVEPNDPRTRTQHTTP